MLFQVADGQGTVAAFVSLANRILVSIVEIKYTGSGCDGLAF
jgi:hypothetical protein